MLSSSRTAEVLRKETVEAKEEHVLVEMARIDSLKEPGDIEAQREKEANEILFNRKDKEQVEGGY